MSEKLTYEDPKELSFGNDWPQYLEKGTEVYGVIIGMNDRDPFRYFEFNGTTFLSLNVQFRVVDHGPLNGYTIRDNLVIPADGEKVTVKSKESNDKIRKRFGALGIDFVKWPVPVSGEEGMQMLDGVGAWEGSGGIFGRLVKMTAGNPKPAYTNIKGQIKGPFTRFGWWAPCSENVAALLADEYKALCDKLNAEKAAAQHEASGGYDDEQLPF